MPPEITDKDAYIDLVCRDMLPVIAREGLAEAVDAFCEGIAFSPDQIARVFEAARRHGLNVKLHADQLSNLGGASLAARFAALSADHLEYTDEAGAEAMAKAGTIAVLLPGAYYFIRETQAPPVEAFRRHGVPMAVATDCNPGTSPLTSLLAAMNMAATLFRLTVEENIAGVTREAARALGRLGETGTLEAGQALRSRHLGYRAPGRARLPPRLQPAACAHLEGRMTAETRLNPGAVPLTAWRDVHVGARIALDLACRTKVEAAAATIEAIVAKGEPVYGVNTGFGKLASVRIGKDDLAALQRNIVLSHASGVGEPIPEAIVRLILALKVTSLAQGASGVRWATIEQILACLEHGLLPLIPSQGSVGASGDLAPLAHLAAALMGVGAFLIDGETVPAEAALRRAGLAPLVLAPKEGLALLNGTQVSTALALAGLFEAEKLFRRRACHRRALDRCGEGFGRPLRRAHPEAARPSRPDRGRRSAARA